MTTPTSQRSIQLQTPAATTSTLRLVPTTPAPKARAANGNDRSAAIAQLYTTHRAALVLAARRYVGKADADDAVQEAFAILLASPTRATNRSTLWAIVRDVCSDRAAQLARCDSYVGEDDEGDEEVHAARTWIGRALE